MPEPSNSNRTRPRTGVFISYARSDGREFAAHLRERLEADGIVLWQDLLGMEGGRDWWLQITDALDHVEVMALVMTPSSLQSPAVRAEWRYARQEGVCVYPIKGAPDLDFDAMPRWMSEKHFYDLDEPLQWEKFLNDLNNPSDEPRVPFMVEPLPPDFVPRPGEFEQLLAYLLDRKTGDPVAITAALRGAGGYGKTTLAQAICHNEEVQSAFDDGILWVTLGEMPGNLTARVIDLIEVLTGERPGFSDVNAAKTRLRELLADRDILLVIDDVWNSTHLIPFMQTGTRGGRLITTRIADVLPSGSKQVDVDAMRRGEAIVLLSSSLPAECTVELRELAIRLGEWPLLLGLTNRVLRNRVEDLQQPLRKAIEWVNKSLDKRGLTAFDALDPQAREQAVSKCLGVSIELLNPNERARYGELAVFPEDIDVPLATVARLWAKTGGLDDFDTEALCERLDRLSLLQRFDPNVQVIRLHDVLRSYLVEKQGQAIAGLHKALLEAHRPSSGPVASDPCAAGWANLPGDEPYLWDQLAHHLIAADLADELIATVKDLRYLAAKMMARTSLSVESDLLAAEELAPDDPTLRALRRSFGQSRHVLDRCNDLDVIEATLHSRLQHVKEMAPIIETVAGVLRRPFIEAEHPLPDSDPAQVRTLAGHSEWVTGCAISADGSIIVSSSDDKTLKLWDARTGAELRTLVGHSLWVKGCAISADGSLVVSASSDETLKLWDARTGADLRTLAGHSGSVRGCAISADGSIIVSASDDRTLKLWDARTGSELRTLAGHSGWVWDCAMSADGALVVSASDDTTLKLWDTRTGAELRTLSGHSGGVHGCAISADGTVVVSASAEGNLKVWDARSGAALHTLTGTFGVVNGCAITPDGSIIASAPVVQPMRLWNARTGAELRVLPGHSDQLNACAISADGSIIVSASADKTLRLWEARTAANVPADATHSEEVNGCAISTDGSMVVSGSRDKTVKLWDACRGAVLRTFAGHSGWVSDCAMSADGALVVSASDDETLKLWDAHTGAPLRTLVGHGRFANYSMSAPVYGCAISNDGSLVVSASADQTVRLWDARTGAQLHMSGGERGRYMLGCAISPDGKIIIAASSDRTLRLWEARTGAELRTLAGHSAAVNACTISADGSLIVSASSDQTLKLWDARSGAELRTLAGHSGPVNGCAIDADASIIVSASDDQTLRLWDARKGTCLATLHVDGALNDCALSADGRRIIAVGARGVYFLRPVW